MKALYRVAIVGASSLKGKELKEVLQEHSFPASDVRLLDDELPGKIDAIGEEATFIQQVGVEELDKVDFAFFTAEPDFTRKHLPIVERSGRRVIDLSYALEDGKALVSSPWVAAEQGQTVQIAAKQAVVAHPAATVLALLLMRAQRAAKIRNAVVTAFEPASERDKRGIDELHQQTINLLSFKSMPTEVYDSQAAFNMLGRYGEKASPTLESVERRILQHYDQITGGTAPVPSLMLAQAPIFHGHVFSIYIELEKEVSVGDLSQELESEHIAVMRLAEDSPNNVNVAGQEKVQVSVRRDVRDARGMWLWAVADNLRIAAITAVEVAAAMARGETI
jgi:aspartate-semialdehyde dehydrogenase